MFLFRFTLLNGDSPEGRGLGESQSKRENFIDSIMQKKPMSLGLEVMTGIKKESHKFIESIRKANALLSIQKSEDWYDGSQYGYELGLIQMHLNQIENETLG